MTGAGVASAHVTVSAPDAAAGGYAEVAFRVPDESATAGTVKLEVTLPQDHPLTEVRTLPTPGWQAELRRTPLATPLKDDDGHQVTDYVSAVLFTAQNGTQIGPGQFGEFKLLVGPLPNASEVAFPAIQTYSDGTTVSWIERSTDGTEPEKPAPVLHLTAAPGDGHGQPSAAPEQQGRQQDSDATEWLAGIALALSIVTLGVVVAPRLRRSRGE